MSPYSKAQTGMAMLKDAVHSLLETRVPMAHQMQKLVAPSVSTKVMWAMKGTFPERSWVSWNLKRW